MCVCVFKCGDGVMGGGIDVFFFFFLWVIQSVYACTYTGPGVSFVCVSPFFFCKKKKLLIVDC